MNSFNHNLGHCRDKEKCEKITQSLGISVSARDKRLIQTDPKGYLKALCTEWIPLSQAVLCILENKYRIWIYKDYNSANNHSALHRFLLISVAGTCEHLPSPLNITGDRVEGLMCGSTYSFDAFPPDTQALKRGMYIVHYTIFLWGGFCVPYSVVSGAQLCAVTWYAIAHCYSTLLHYCVSLSMSLYMCAQRTAYSQKYMCRGSREIIHNHL